MLWLEPLVEVETDGGRVGYGNITAEVGPCSTSSTAPTVHRGRRRPPVAGPPAPGVLRPGRGHRADRPRRHTASTAGSPGWLRALELAPEEVVAEVTTSGLRGRGGAGFPAGIKWETVRTASADVKFVCCNADEGDSGTFADRMLIEGDPFTLIEGMTIAAYAVGATEGYIYLRSEYPTPSPPCAAPSTSPTPAAGSARASLGSGLTFDLDVRVGAGAYICGEETSMLEPRGQARRGARQAPDPGARGSSAGPPSSTTC
jgi:formate dehydrogenase iron-sulfur subunit